MDFRTRGYRAGRLGRLLTAAGALLSLAGCDNLVDFEVRDQLPGEALNNAAGAQALYAGALRSFGIAFAGDGGGTEGQALISGMMADEWLHSGTFNTRVDYDRRETQLNNGTLAGVYRNLQTGRTSALRALDALQASGAPAATDTRYGEMYNRVGAVFLMGAMNYCNGIVFSSQTPAGEFVYGGQITNAQALDSATAYFDLALAGAGPANLNLARLLKARALMMRGPTQYAQAAQLVAGIPTSFRAVNEHSLNANQNGIFVFNVLSERWTLSHLEGVNGLPFRGAGDGTNPALADPRVPWKRDGADVGFDNVTPQYDLQIYTDRANPSVWAKGEEARLIEAEAALSAGNVAGWLTILNTLRAGVAGLPPLADPGTTAGRVDLLFRERAFWLFANGTRLMDLRRLIRHYGRSSEQVFPTGTYPRPSQGGVYGSDVNFPVPDVENQNPALGQTNVVCIDRNA